MLLGPISHDISISISCNLESGWYNVQISIVANEIVIKQVDKDDYFYVIKHGLFEIFVNGQLVLKIGDGRSFGEHMLMYNTPHAATVRTKTNRTL